MPAPRKESSFVVSTFFAASSSRWRDELRLRQRRLEVERALEADAGGDVPEELLDRRDADRREHLLAVGVREREVARSYCSARSCLYASTSSSESTSEASESRIRIEPALAVRILVHRLGRVDDLLVHLEDLAGERRDHIGDGLDGLDLAVRGVLRDRRALARAPRSGRARRARPARTR